jgi:hypothetical protein
MAASHAQARLGLPEPERESRAPMLRLAAVDQPAAPSPVHGLHETLNAAFTSEEAAAQDSDRWSMRRTIAFVTVVCGGFWLALGAAVYFLLR